ncbi:MAG: PepSY domain-containing protein [Myxococcales bacterium]|nr:PepSY domain-containing protein [Myxococcales bacterium]MCB9755510.1 PepSY domain-containing protein [Myxococcales bacterium]
MTISRRAHFRWHQAVGLSIGLLAVIIAVSGSILVFRDQLKQPPPAAPIVETPISLDALVERAVAAGDGSPATDLAIPQEPGAAYRVWLDDDAETLVFLDGRGEVLETRSTAGGLTRWVFKLHTGELIGTPGRALALLTGVGLCVLAYTGAAMIVSRRRRRRRRGGTET